MKIYNLITAMMLFVLALSAQTGPGWYRVAEADAPNNAGTINLVAPEGTLSFNVNFGYNSINTGIRKFYIDGVDEYANPVFDRIRLVVGNYNQPAYVEVYLKAAATVSTTIDALTGVDQLTSLNFTTAAIPSDYFAFSFNFRDLQYRGSNWNFENDPAHFGTALLYSKSDSVCIDGGNCIPMIVSPDTNLEYLHFDAATGKLLAVESGDTSSTVIFSQDPDNDLSYGADGGVKYISKDKGTSVISGIFNISNNPAIPLVFDENYWIETTIGQSDGSNNQTYGVIPLDTAGIKGGRTIYVKHSASIGTDYAVKFTTNATGFDIAGQSLSDTLTLENQGDWAVLLYGGNRFITLQSGTSQSIPGPQGEQGPIGPQGPIGLTGPAGADGAQGPQGSIGLTGPAGADGSDGAQGPQGPIGLTGPAGADGSDGAQGPQGPIGLTGPAGADGSDGAQGPQGPIGLTGPAGADGSDGAQGPQGPIGLTGPAGADGSDGAQGPQGPIGLTGPAGADGSDGAQGLQGPIGLTGPAGADGPQGPAGQDATSTCENTKEFTAVIEEIDNPFFRSNQVSVLEFDDETRVFYNVHTDGTGDFANRSLVMKSSCDRKTWSAVVDLTGQLGFSPDGWGPPSLMRLSGDTILMVMCNNDGTYYSGTGYDSDIYRWLSYDRGSTWQPRSTIVDDSWYYPAAPDKLFRSQSGRIFYPIPFSDNGGTSSQDLNAEMVVYYSDDDGITWTRNETGFIAPNGKTFETGIYQNLISNRLVAWARTKDAHNWESYSDDNGLTWSAGYRGSLISENSQTDIKQQEGIFYAVTTDPEYSPFDNSTVNVDYNRKKYLISTASYTSDDQISNFQDVYALFPTDGVQWGQVNNVTISLREGSLYIYYSKSQTSINGNPAPHTKWGLQVKHIPLPLAYISSRDRKESAIYDMGIVVGQNTSDLKIPTNTIRFPQLTPSSIAYLDQNGDLQPVQLGNGLSLVNGILSYNSNNTDSDSDGVLATIDCDDNDPTIGAAGSACDDGDPNTANDVLNSNCICQGEVAAIWENLVNMSVVTDGLEKTSGGDAWNAGANSTNTIPTSTDGWFKSEINDASEHYFIGLNDDAGGSSYTDIDYAIYVHHGGTLGIYENNVIRVAPTAGPTYQVGDIIRIERIGTVINYLLNGTVFYTSTVASTTSLVADMAAKEPNSLIKNPGMSHGGSASRILGKISRVQKKIGRLEKRKEKAGQRKVKRLNRRIKKLKNRL